MAVADESGASQKPSVESHFRLVGSCLHLFDFELASPDCQMTRRGIQPNKGRMRPLGARSGLGALNFGR
jgi:hypothetical protein